MMNRIRRNPWPYAIVGYFAVFITAMGAWITFAVRNDMELVRADYYDHEMKFQAQIDRVARTASVRKDVQLAYRPEQSSITISLPSEHRDSSLFGEVHLYRPSDEKLDEKFPIALSKDGSQVINVARLQRGLWKLRLTWTANGSEYYFDQAVVIASK